MGLYLIQWGSWGQLESSWGQPGDSQGHRGSSRKAPRRCKLVPEFGFEHHVCSRYKIRCPPNTASKNGRRGAFPIIQYQEERRIEQQLLLDGKFEMMDERTYCYWMAKPKNGAMEPELAKHEWLKLCEAEGAITDLLGKTERYPMHPLLQSKRRHIVYTSV